MILKKSTYVRINDVNKLCKINLERFKKTAEQISNNSRILEIGFGEAFLPHFLEGKKYCWRGMEYDQELAISAKEQGFDAYCASADDIWKEEDNSYDVVVFMNVLEHIENQQFALREAKRVLKGGGIVIGTVPYGTNIKKIYYESKGVEEVNGYDFCSFGKNEVIISLKRVGLVPVSVDRICGFIPFLQIPLNIFGKNI